MGIKEDKKVEEQVVNNDNIQNWETVFIILIICSLIMMLIIIIFIYDSPRQSIHNHDMEKTLNIKIITIKG